MSKEEFILVNKEAYKKIANKYHEKTKDLDMYWQTVFFSNMLPKKGTILDFMSGPSRDAITFTKRGYKVTCMDYEQQFLDQVVADVASAKTVQGDARTVRIGEEFDGVWCNAGIFMLPKTETNAVLETIANHLKVDGALYINCKLKGEDDVEERVYFDRKYDVNRYECFFSPQEFKKALSPFFDVRREMIAYAQNVAYRTHPILDIFAVKK